MSIFDLLQQGVQGLVNSIPKAAESPKELARKNADRHRPIGSVAYRNGKKVLWAGQRYDYQSPEMYKQLQDKGEFKFLNITGHQIREGALSIIPRETKDAVKKKISDTSKLLAEGDLALKDLSEVHNPGSTLAIEQRREKASEAVSAVTTPLSNASKWFSDKTNTAPWVSDEVGAALITGGTSLIARRFMQAVKLANTARRISSTADKVTTTANQARQLGKFSNNAIMRAKLGGAAAQRVKQSGSANLSNIVDLKDNSLTYLDNVISDSKQSLDQIARGQIKGTKSDVRSLAAIATGASRAQGFVRVMGEKTDALDLLNDPQTLVSGLANRQRTLTQQPAGVGVIGHHTGMVKTFELPYLQMDLKKGLEVNKILGDKHNILLGQESSNLQNMYSQLIHNTVAHAGSTKDIHIRTAFNKVDWRNLTPEEAADAIAKQYWVAEQQAWKAGVHPINVDAGWRIYNALPPSMKKKLPRGFNPLDPKDNTEAYARYRLLVNNLNPKIKQDLLRATAEAENSLLSTYK